MWPPLQASADQQKHDHIALREVVALQRTTAHYSVLQRTTGALTHSDHPLARAWKLQEPRL